MPVDPALVNNTKSWLYQLEAATMPAGATGVAGVTGGGNAYDEARYGSFVFGRNDSVTVLVNGTGLHAAPTFLGLFWNAVVLAANGAAGEGAYVGKEGLAAAAGRQGKEGLALVG